MEKMETKFKIECIMDGEVFYGDFKGHEKRKLLHHLKKKYGITYQEYQLKYFYNDKWPLCACGCGVKVRYDSGQFHKFYLNHKNLMKVGETTIKKIKDLLIIRNEINNKLKRSNVTSSTLEVLYEKYCNFEIDSEYIKSNTALDYRTIKSYWSELGLINDKEVFRRITKKHQMLWHTKNETRKTQVDEQILLDLYFYLKQNKMKITLREVIRKFSLKNTQLVLYKRLVEKFGKEEIDGLLISGISSKPEIEYFNVLKFFFGDIKKQFKLEGKHYDYKLGNILVEFDGSYWHSSERAKVNDKLKDEIAMKNGYKIFRIKESEWKNIDILSQLKKMYENENKI